MLRICGSTARSLGRKMRVGQLSMMAGAMALPSMSLRDWVAKMTEAFFFRSVFSHSRSCSRCVPIRSDASRSRDHIRSRSRSG